MTKTGQHISPPRVMKKPPILCNSKSWYQEKWSPWIAITTRISSTIIRPSPPRIYNTIWTLDTSRIFFPSSFCFQLWQPTPSPSPQNCLVYSSSSPSNRYMQYVHRDFFISSFQLIYLLLLRSDQVISLDERWWKIRPSTDCKKIVLLKN